MIDDIIINIDDDLLELKKIIERGEFDFSSIGGENDIPTYQLIAAAYRAGKAAANN